LLTIKRINQGSGLVAAGEALLPFCACNRRLLLVLSVCFFLRGWRRSNNYQLFVSFCRYNKLRREQPRRRHKGIRKKQFAAFLCISFVAGIGYLQTPR